MLEIKINNKEFVEDIKTRLTKTEQFLQSINNNTVSDKEQFGVLISPFSSLMFNSEDELKKALEDEIFNLKRALSAKVQSILDGK